MKNDPAEGMAFTHFILLTFNSRKVFMTSYRVSSVTSGMTGRPERKKQARPGGRSGIRLCLLLALLCHTGLPESASGATNRKLDANYTSNTTLQSDSNYENTKKIVFVDVPIDVTINKDVTVGTTTTTNINIIGKTISLLTVR